MRRPFAGLPDSAGRLLLGLLIGPCADKRELDGLAIQRLDRTPERNQKPDNQHQYVEAQIGKRLEVCVQHGKKAQGEAKDERQSEEY